MTIEDLSGTHRKSAEVVALTEENRVLKLRLKEEEAE